MTNLQTMRCITMKKSKRIKTVVYFPNNRDAFEKLYVDATFEAIKQLARTTSPPNIPDKKNDKDKI